MGIMSEIREIDLTIHRKIGGFTSPEEKELKLKQISEIPELIKKIRKLKYGPKLDLFGEKITAEFKAGFYGEFGNYLEQLDLLFKNS
ncbi:MAG: hypothetical protein ACHQUC_00165, partial [Chlamydiales bacterium]